MATLKTPHWTSSTNSFVAKISGDFILQIEQKLDQEVMSRAKFAARLNVTEGSVSQTLNRPPNFKLSTSVEYARALGLKVALVAYDDGDPDNERGPINSEIFYECWKRAGRPIDFFDLRGAPQELAQSVNVLEGEAPLNALGAGLKKSPQRAENGRGSDDYSNNMAASL